MSERRRTPFDDLDDHAVLKTADIAARLRVEPRSVRRAIERGDLPASRACGLRVLAADAAEWWRAHAVVAADQGVHFERASVAPVPAPKRARRRSSRLPLPPRGGGAR